MGKGKRTRDTTQTQGPAVTYWHGGRAGLTAGGELVPGTEVARRAGLHISADSPGYQDYRPDFVYITTDRDLALDFAILQGHLEPAALYRVDPIGSTQHDPDFPAGVSFRCRRATVRAVDLHPIGGTMPLTRAAHHYQTWDDGEDLYDPNGYARPSKSAQHLGVTTGDLFTLGRYPEFDLINARCSEVVRARNPGLTPQDALRVRQLTGGIG